MTDIATEEEKQKRQTLTKTKKLGGKIGKETLSDRNRGAYTRIHTLTDRHTQKKSKVNI